MKIERIKGEIVIGDGIISFKESERIGHGYDTIVTEPTLTGDTLIHVVKIVLSPNGMFAPEFDTEEEAKAFSKALTSFLLKDEIKK